MDRHFKSESGFSLFEILVLVIVTGIVLAAIMQWMSPSVDDYRRSKTEIEMNSLAEAIVGNPNMMVDGKRCDFGYVGDVGSFPPNLSALIQNPGGLATWEGPYLPAGFSQDSTSLLIDEWGQPYNYSGGVNLISSGGGKSIVKNIANAASDYLSNRCYGTILDADDSVPGTILKDSIDIEINIPDGAGSILTKSYKPDAFGTFMLDSLPVGQHQLNFIYNPSSDTLHRFLTILPRHKSSVEYKFAAAYFSSGIDSCTRGGVIVLRPDGTGKITELKPAGGCSYDWECVDEEVPDDNASRVRIRSDIYRSDTYSITDPAPLLCNIIRMTVYVRARKQAGGGIGYIRPVVSFNGITYEGSEQTITDVYANYNHQWLFDPSDGAAWTWADIQSLEIGVSMRASLSSHEISCTQVWAEIEYGL